MHEPAPFRNRPTELTVKGSYSVGEFFAMGCPCQVLMETTDRRIAEALLARVRDEAWRIEALWSRYIPSSLIQQINESPHKTHELDPETCAVVDYCDTLWRLSERAFDITSGVLRKIWTFDGGQTVPSKMAIEKMLEHVGWDRVTWQSPNLTLQPGMQIDLGGVGKEYAVDICVGRLAKYSDVSCLVNFGGDCAVSLAPTARAKWDIGIESADVAGKAVSTVGLAGGGLATSGNAFRFVMHKGKRLSHILDARAGWPVEDAPRSITVQAASCLEAGMFATLACLQGAAAEDALCEAGVIYWIQP